MSMIKRLFINFTDLFKLSSGKLAVLLVMLLIGGLAAGCVSPTGQPRGWSGGVVDDGTLFLGSMGGTVVAWNASTGAELWSTTLEPRKQRGGFGCAAAPAGVAIYGTPAVAEGLVYVSVYDGKIYAFNLSRDAEEWQYPPGEDDYIQPIVGGPVVSLGKVYFGCADHKLYALDAGTGVERWEFATGDKIWGTPAIEDDVLYIGSFDKKLYAIGANDGQKKWEVETGGAVAGTPVIDNKTVYFGSFDRYFYAVNAADGSLKWRSEIKAGSWFWAKPVIHNSTVYAPCLDGKVYILSAESGREVVAAIDLGSPIASSPVLIDNALIIATEAGGIYSLDTGTNDIKSLTDLEVKIHAPLFASGGTVYVHTQEDETLYALNAETGVRLWSLPLTSK